MFFTVVPMCGLLTLEAVRRHPRRPTARRLMPVYPTLVGGGGDRRGRARARRVAHRPVPPAAPTGSRWRSVRLHDPGRRVAHEALGADRHLPARRHQRLRPVWDILAEEFVYAFALLTLVMLCGSALGVREPAGGRRVSCRSCLLGVVRRDGGRQLRHPPLGDARVRDGLAPQPPRAARRVASSATTCSRCASRPSASRCSRSAPSGCHAAWWVGAGVTAYGACLPGRPRRVHPPPPAGGGPPRRLPRLAAGRAPRPPHLGRRALRDAAAAGARASSRRSTAGIRCERIAPGRAPGGPHPVVALDGDARGVGGHRRRPRIRRRRAAGSRARRAASRRRRTSGPARPDGSRPRSARSPLAAVGRQVPLARPPGEQRAGLGEPVLPPGDRETRGTTRRRPPSPGAAAAGRRARSRDTGSRWTA